MNISSEHELRLREDDDNNPNNSSNISSTSNSTNTSTKSKRSRRTARSTSRKWEVLKKTYLVIQNINIYKKIIKITKKNE
jgi:hypothetical protein